MSDNEDQEQEAIVVSEQEDPDYVPPVVEHKVVAKSLQKMDLTAGNDLKTTQPVPCLLANSIFRRNFVCFHSVGRGGERRRKLWRPVTGLCARSRS